MVRASADVAIIGGGLVGCFPPISCAHDGRSVT